MNTGKVKSVKGSYGFIQPDQGGKDIYFKVQWVKGIAARDVKEDLRVEFEVEETERGPQTRMVRAIGDVEQTTDDILQANHGSYHFLNPYNFIRFATAPRSFRNDPDTLLLGRATSPPHDRYLGLSGTITCELEAVTPLFVADTVSDFASDEDRKEEHKRFQFFSYDFGNGPEPAIPASSLRGMLRSLFEAATNSCYAHFDYERRLSYHLAATEALKLVPSRVERDEKGRWQLRLLPGDARLQIDSRPRDRLYAARVEQYQALVSGRPRNAKTKTKVVFNPVDLGNLQHGDHCYALAEQLSFPPVWQVRRISTDLNELWKHRRPEKGDQNRIDVLEGYLCLNNQNIEAKRFERFFFRAYHNKVGPEHVVLTQDVIKDYNLLISDYQERHARTVEKWQQSGRKPDQIDKTKKESAFSRFIAGEGKAPSLAEGDLVYAMLSGAVSAPTVEFIVPVAVPRVLYERKIAHLLPQHLWKCNKHDELCPACRTFGWVYGDEEASIETLQGYLAFHVSYAGRVRLSYGKLLQPASTLPETSLAILSSPKPTTSRFYLMPSNGKPKDGQSDFVTGYDNIDNMLRGRKIYRHHGHDGDKGYWNQKSREYQRVGKNSDQNRTLKDPLAPGTKFRFTIDFSNLAPLEIGALLWTLEMEGEQVHRLGLAKPLGFGSVRIRTEAVHLFNFANRYTSINTTNDKVRLSDERIRELKQQFKDAMQRAYGHGFLDLPQIRDILTLLSQPSQDLPIHYPRPTQQVDPEGKNYEWFVGNNRNKDARFSLELPEQEQGLPLIDRNGRIKK